MSATLDQLAAQADALGTADDSDQGTTAPGQEAPQAIGNAQALAGALAAGREAFCYFTKLQSPRTVLDDTKVQSLGALWAPVLDKHGVNLGDMMGDYALEFAAIIGTIGILSELRAAVGAEIATRKKTEDAKTVDAVPEVAEGE